jgi:hypothetical protein
MSGLGIAALAILGPVGVFLAIAIALRLRARKLCRCGHDRQAHRHYRPGSDCGLCECPRWTRRYSANGAGGTGSGWPGTRETS